MTKPVTCDQKSVYQEALDNMKTALELLDEAGAPPEIGAHLDLAMHRLTPCINGYAAA